jgi:hypothetical protein
MKSTKQRNGVMKKLLLILGAAAGLVLAGCNQGGTSDQYGTSSGAATNSMPHHGTGTNRP